MDKRNFANPCQISQKVMRAEIREQIHLVNNTVCLSSYKQNYNWKAIRLLHYEHRSVFPKLFWTHLLTVDDKI